MSHFSFPDDWDARAVTAYGALIGKEPEERIELLQRVFSSDDLEFFGDLILAISMLHDWNENEMTPSFANLIRTDWGAAELPKLAAFATSNILNAANDSDSHGELDVLHKNISAILFEAFTDSRVEGRLVLKNQASVLTLNKSPHDLSVSFEIDGAKDGGAQTITTMAPHTLQVYRDTFHENLVRHAEFVSARYCSGMAVFNKVEELERHSVWAGLTELYRPFRSVGKLKVAIACRPGTAWDLVFRTLNTASSYAGYSFKLTNWQL